MTCPGEVIRRAERESSVDRDNRVVRRSCGVQAAGEHCGDTVGSGGANELHPQFKLFSDLLEISRQPSLQETVLK